jgi:hypothetical protein
MKELVFILTLIIVIVLFVRLIVLLVRRKFARKDILLPSIIILTYTVIWLVFKFTVNYSPVPFGTDICFDDWCATVTSFEKTDSLGVEIQKVHPHGQYIILHIRMSNHARGIAQKPSEPRVSIIYDNVKPLQYSVDGQHALERLKGPQAPVDSRLELHQSLETELVFDVPSEARGLKAIIEEGPFITRLIFPSDKEVFFLK